MIYGYLAFTLKLAENAKGTLEDKLERMLLKKACERPALLSSSSE